jgi:hypothetical protein
MIISPLLIQQHGTVYLAKKIDAPLVSPLILYVTHVKEVLSETSLTYVPV